MLLSINQNFPCVSEVATERPSLQCIIELWLNHLQHFAVCGTQQAHLLPCNNACSGAQNVVCIKWGCQLQKINNFVEKMQKETQNEQQTMS
jgi:hypothetical protein